MSENIMKSPTLDTADDLSVPLNIDLDTIIDPIMASRMQSPIVIPSRAEELSALLPRELPHSGLSITQVLTEVQSVTDRYCRRIAHPGFFGFIAPAGLPTDPLAHALVVALNQNVTGYPASPAAASIERTVVNWLSDLVGYPQDADGVMLSGGSMANMTAIGAALINRFGASFRNEGLIAAAGAKQPTIVCSEAVHFSIQRAAALLGIGIDQVVSVEVDDCFRMRPDRLAAALEAQNCPICVVASAGTTTTGAVDPLDEIASICKEAGVWFHVDAAYGGGALLSPELKPLFAGIEHADSVTIDLHKWFYLALDGSVILYRDPSIAKQMFYESSDYVQYPFDGPPEMHMFFHLSPELSRRFRALPLYIALRHYGADRLGRNVLHNYQCAQYMSHLIQEAQELDLVAAPQLSILCFRYVSPELDENTIDGINYRIRETIEYEGDFLMSPTDILSRPVLRVCINNHATRAHHVENLIQRVLELGHRLADDCPKP